MKILFLNKYSKYLHKNKLSGGNSRIIRYSIEYNKSIDSGIYSETTIDTMDEDDFILSFLNYIFEHKPDIKMYIQNILNIGDNILLSEITFKFKLFFLVIIDNEIEVRHNKNFIIGKKIIIKEKKTKELHLKIISPDNIIIKKFVKNNKNISLYELKDEDDYLYNLNNHRSKIKYIIVDNKKINFDETFKLNKNIIYINIHIYPDHIYNNITEFYLKYKNTLDKNILNLYDIFYENIYKIYDLLLSYDNKMNLFNDYLTKELKYLNICSFLKNPEYIVLKNNFINIVNYLEDRDKNEEYTSEFGSIIGRRSLSIDKIISNYGSDINIKNEISEIKNIIKNKQYLINIPNILHIDNICNEINRDNEIENKNLCILYFILEIVIQYIENNGKININKKFIISLLDLITNNENYKNKKKIYFDNIENINLSDIYNKLNYLLNLNKKIYLKFIYPNNIIINKIIIRDNSETAILNILKDQKSLLYINNQNYMINNITINNIIKKIDDLIIFDKNETYIDINLINVI
jgi:hypothetical protein